MPNLVRLPAHVSDDELRVSWDKTQEGDDLHVWGPRSVRRLAMDHFTGKRPKIAGDVCAEFEVRRDGLIVDAPSFLEELEAAGYDPRTLVFSIRKKEATQPEVAVPDDIRAHLEEAQVAAKRLRAAADEAEEAKGVYHLSEDEHTALFEALGGVEEALARALDLLNERAPNGSDDA